MTLRNSTADWQARDAAHHWHPFTDTAALNAKGTRVITHADGVHITDAEGHRMLDGMAGLWNVAVGYGRDEIREAVDRQMRDLPYYNTFFQCAHPPAIALAERVAGLTPPGLDHIFFTGSGSDANDTALRMARTYWAANGKPGKQVIISRRNAYHGSTVAGASLGGMKAMHEQAFMPIPGIHHIAQPYWFDEGGDMSPEDFGVQAARALEAAIEEIGEDKIAAFIAEPIQGAGGVIIPPRTYWPEIKRILADRDILLIVDEVICGFGRLGRWFGSDYYDLSPDIMTMAKALSSGYLPIGAVAANARVMAGFEAVGEFVHGYTYSGHPACCAAALANLDIIEREGLVQRVADDIGPYLAERWRALADHPLIGEARITGLIGAMEIVADKDTRRRFPNGGAIAERCRDLSVANGLVMRAVRDTMIISPPLTLSHAEADELVRIAGRTLDQLHGELRATGTA